MNLQIRSLSLLFFAVLLLLLIQARVVQASITITTDSITENAAIHDFIADISPPLVAGDMITITHPDGAVAMTATMTGTVTLDRIRTRLRLPAGSPVVSVDVVRAGAGTEHAEATIQVAIGFPGVTEGTSSTTGTNTNGNGSGQVQMFVLNDMYTTGYVEILNITTPEGTIQATSTPCLSSNPLFGFYGSFNGTNATIDYTDSTTSHTCSPPTPPVEPDITVTTPAVANDPHAVPVTVEMKSPLVAGDSLYIIHPNDVNGTVAYSVEPTGTVTLDTIETKLRLPEGEHTINVNLYRADGVTIEHGEATLQVVAGFDGVVKGISETTNITSSGSINQVSVDVTNEMKDRGYVGTVSITTPQGAINSTSTPCLSSDPHFSYTGNFDGSNVTADYADEYVLTHSCGADLALPPGILVTLPTIAENGAVVPVTVDMNPPLAAGEKLYLKHPRGAVAYTATPTANATLDTVQTRLRLFEQGTQKVSADVVRSNGSVERGEADTIVTIEQYPVPEGTSSTTQTQTNNDVGEIKVLLQNDMYTTGYVETLTMATPQGMIEATSTPCISRNPYYAFFGGFDGTTATVDYTDSTTRHTCSSPTLVAASLPSSRSAQVGSTVTAFATVINAGIETATGCSIVPVTSVAGDFFYQTTNPATNGLTGSPNTPVDIAAGAFQTFLFAFTPTAAFSPSIVELGYDCISTQPAVMTLGVNTLLLSASDTPIPDIVALAATPTGDGIINIPGETGANAFAVATVNVGASGSITATTDTGGASLPVTLFICETNPATGACLDTPAASVTTTIAGGETPTFGIFVNGSGTVPFDPANNRIFVRFKDAGSLTRGATSVAVRTVAE